jgi:alpha/beta superfamily hydrolase
MLRSGRRFEVSFRLCRAVRVLPTTGRVGGALAAVAVLALASAACTGTEGDSGKAADSRSTASSAPRTTTESSPEPATTASSPEPAAETSEPPAERCGPPNTHGRALWFRASDRTRLEGATVGKGSIGVVFVHEYPGPRNGPYCGFWSFAASLAPHGIRSLLFNLRCYGDSQCPDETHNADVKDVRGAIGTLRRLGARKVVLMGASMGGVVVLRAGAAIRPPVAGVVSLSGELNLGPLLGPEDLDAGKAAPQVVSPTFLAVAEGDTYASVADTKTIYRRLGARRKRLVVGGAGHGWQLLDAPGGGGSPLARQVTSFILAVGR